jgi:hypothetical protein
MTEDPTVAAAADRLPDPPDSAVGYLVLLPSLQSAVAPAAMLAGELLGPSHPVTAGLALGLLYGTVLTGPLALLGLPLDARRRRRREGERERSGEQEQSRERERSGEREADGVTSSASNAPRWQWYAAAAVGLAAVLASHLTLGDALAGLLEPALSLAAAMVPVGLAYHYRRWRARADRQIA